MRKTPLACVTAAAIVMLACTLDGAQQKGRPNYYPLKQGSKWQYHAEVTGQAPATFVVQVVKNEKVDGVDAFRVETFKQGQMVGSEVLSTTDRGVVRHRFNDQQAKPPAFLIKYPVIPGESWQDEVEVGDQKMKIKYRVGKEEDVKVPAGSFKAVVVNVDVDVAGKTFTNSYWFVADVGIVKQSADITGQKVTLELEKYELAK